MDISDISPGNDAPIETFKSPEIASPSPNSTPPSTLSLADADKDMVKISEPPAASSLALAEAFESPLNSADADAAFPSIPHITNPTASLVSVPAAATLPASSIDQASAVDVDAFSQEDADMLNKVDAFCERAEAEAAASIDDAGDDFSDDDEDVDISKHVELFCKEVESAALKRLKPSPQLIEADALNHPNPALVAIIGITGDDDDDDNAIFASRPLPRSSGQGN